MKKELTILAMGLLMVSCSSSFDAGESGAMDSGENGSGNTNAGILTAGEWNDLQNWDFWNELISVQHPDKHYEHLEYWSMYTSRRFPVTVTDSEGNPVCGAKVKLFVNGDKTPMWTAITDNQGSAELWFNMEGGPEAAEVMTFTASVDNGKPVTVGGTQNVLTASDVKTSQSADIAFIVDATGSMGDEITFLKDDLLDIIEKASANASGISLRTGALFYRDEGDDYLTRTSNFSEDPQNTLKFIRNQKADGGGDYPEAVHTALEDALQKLSWEENNYARIAFLLLDAPPHYEQKVLKSIHSSVKMYAAKGIKLIPVAASGIDKKTEFLLRLMAIFTDGTYVFITDDSGVGEDHLEPTVGSYQTEQLNSLIVRLIKKYTE